MGIGFNISVVESTPIMHVNLVIILEMHDKKWNITSDRAFSSSIWATIWTISTVFFMLELAVVRKNIMTTQNLVSARKFQ